METEARECLANEGIIPKGDEKPPRSLDAFLQAGAGKPLRGEVGQGARAGAVLHPESGEDAIASTLIGAQQCSNGTNGR